MSDRKYYDIDGNEVTLYKLVRLEPEWAVSRIKHTESFEQLQAETVQRCIDATESCRGANDQNILHYDSGFDDAIDYVVQAIREAQN